MSNQIYTVQQLRNLLVPVFKRYNIRRAILLGSYSKGLATKTSDVDLLVDSGLKGLKFVGLIEDVRLAVDKDVDVFDVAHIEKGSPFDREIEKSGVLIYEK